MSDSLRPQMGIFKVLGRVGDTKRKKLMKQDQILEYKCLTFMDP